MSQNPIEMLYDENNTDPIVLYGENGDAVSFEQVALIPVKNRHFAILRPLENKELAEDEAIVFEVGTDKDGDFIEVLEDEDIIDAVFDIYNAAI